MSNLSQFSIQKPVAKFQEFNATGTFTPSQALIDAGGHVKIFIVGGGASASGPGNGGNGGEVLTKHTYLTNTNPITVTIGAGGALNGNSGGDSVFAGSAAGGLDITAKGGFAGVEQQNSIGASWGNGGYNQGGTAAGSGVMGFGAGSRHRDTLGGGVVTGKANSGQASAYNYAGGSGYCLIEWVE